MDLSCLQYDSSIVPLPPLDLLSYLSSHTLYPSSYWTITCTPSCVVDLPWCSYLYKYSFMLRISPKLFLLCNLLCTFVFSSLVQFTKSQTCNFAHLDSVVVLCLSILIPY